MIKLYSKINCGLGPGTQLTENVSGTLCFCYIKVWLGLTSSERYYYVSLWFHKGLADPFVLKTLFKH